MDNWERLNNEIKNLRRTVAAQDRAICDLKTEVYRLKAAQGVVTATEYLANLPKKCTRKNPSPSTA